MLLERVPRDFDRISEGQRGHVINADGVVYEQPYVFLTMHLLEMWAAGFDQADFDTLAVVSGASALHAYESGEFMPKHAHLLVGPAERIAEAMGFGYEWVRWNDVEEAWQVLKESLDSGRAVKGWDWENCLFCGYDEEGEERRVFVVTEGPETFAQWRSWEQFMEWAERVGEWNQREFGRFAGPVDPLPEEEVAVRVLRDLVAWSDRPPEQCEEHFTNATFGLSAIAAYEQDCADLERFEDWVLCHAINPQWTIRHSTAVYLERLAAREAFTPEVRELLRAAAEHYRKVFAAWRESHELLGHKAPEEAGQTRERRELGAALVRLWLQEETQAIIDLRQALELM